MNEGKWAGGTHKEFVHSLWRCPGSSWKCGHWTPWRQSLGNGQMPCSLDVGEGKLVSKLPPDSEPYTWGALRFRAGQPEEMRKSRRVIREEGEEGASGKGKVMCRALSHQGRSLPPTPLPCLRSQGAPRSCHPVPGSPLASAAKPSPCRSLGSPGSSRFLPLPVLRTWAWRLSPRL